MILPSPSTDEEFDKVKKDSPVFKEAIRSFFKEKVSATNHIHLFEDGSYPTYSIDGKLVAKFFPDIFLDSYEAEITALKALSKINFLSPKLISTKQALGWNVVLMEQLSGVPLKTIWADLSDMEKHKISFKMGQQIKELHSIKSLDEKNERDWEEFIRSQKEQCYGRHKRLGLREGLLNQIPDFIESIKLPYKNLVYLHTEVMPDHVIINKVSREIEISGLIDFEPSMWGSLEYEFASVGVFVARGDRKVFKSFIDGYGLNIDADFHKRLMAYLILHRYSNLVWYLKLMPEGSSLDELAEKWFKV